MTTMAIAATTAIALLQFIFVHGPKGQEIRINVEEIVSLRVPPKHHFAPEIKCLVFMDGGNFVGIRESCEEVLRLVGEVEGK